VGLVSSMNTTIQQGNTKTTFLTLLFDALCSGSSCGLHRCLDRRAQRSHVSSNNFIIFHFYWASYPYFFNRSWSSIWNIIYRFPEERKNKRTQRPYLINFDATGSPCHELTSWDNSSSMSIWLGRKESHCEDILPVSSTDGSAISPTISLALSLWYTRKCEIKENLSGVLFLHVKLRNTK
jgi:hypothetical protein